MTYGRLKATTTGLLTGDNVLSNDPEVLLGLLEMAFNDTVTHADALHLMTLNKDNDVARLANGPFLMRYPALPTRDEDDMDIDNELCFPIARFLASYISSEKARVHFSEAKRLIRDYNGKVYEILESVKEQEDGTYDV